MIRKPGESNWTWILGRFRTRFLEGLLVVVPIAASILILIWIFTTVDNILQPVIREVIRWATNNPDYNGQITGLGFVITIFLVLIAGVIAGNFVGRKIIAFGDSILKHVPLFRQIYTGAKQVVDGFSGTGAISKAAFREVVLVEFPAKGMTTVAFITNEYKAENGKNFYAVYIPTSPTPWAGFAAIVDEESMTRTTFTVDEALKMCISGMMISPTTVKLTSGGRSLKLKASNILKTEAEEPPKG